MKGDEYLLRLQLIKRAELLARFVHMGQKRRDGSDYVDNHQAIMVGMMIRKFYEEDPNFDEFSYSEEQADIICSIWLHDVFEDCGWQNRMGIHQIVANYFNPTTIHVVAVLTHEKDETYHQYIEKIALHPIALEIKFLDMINNTAKNVPEKQMKKYHDALIHLMSLVKQIEIPVILIERLKL